jgi:hypothetical protein
VVASSTHTSAARVACLRKYHELTFR